MIIAIAIAAFYILVYFQHIEDKNTAIFPKTVVVIGISLTCYSILMLPLDVANTSTNGGFPMNQLWETIYILIACFAVVIIPFTIFYYEAEEPGQSNSKQIKTAIKWELVTLLICAIITIVLWLAIGYVEIPATDLSANLVPSSFPMGTRCGGCSEDTNQTIDFQISLILYIISMLAFAGLFLFVLFGGIGLAALPMDLINAFRKRPKPISLQEYAKFKLKIGSRAQKLLEIGNKLQEKLSKHGGRPKTRSEKRQYNKFRANVFLLEEDFMRLETSYNRGIGPRILRVFWDYTQLLFGILGVFISILWWLQIILFVIATPPVTPLLNQMFTALDSVFGLFGTAFYALFAFYLLWCVIKGNFKFGLRIPFLFEIHPMKVGETMMNSFLFNVNLVMISSVTVVQFCSVAFSIYNRFTGVEVLFNVGVKNLVFFRYFWYYYYWVFVILAALAMIYLLLFPSDRKQAERGYKPLKEEDLPR